MRTLAILLSDGACIDIITNVEVLIIGGAGPVTGSFPPSKLRPGGPGSKSSRWSDARSCFRPTGQRTAGIHGALRWKIYRQKTGLGASTVAARTQTAADWNGGLHCRLADDALEGHSSLSKISVGGRSGGLIWNSIPQAFVPETDGILAARTSTKPASCRRAIKNTPPLELRLRRRGLPRSSRQGWRSAVTNRVEPGIPVGRYAPNMSSERDGIRRPHTLAWESRRTHAPHRKKLHQCGSKQIWTSLSARTVSTASFWVVNGDYYKVAFGWRKTGKSMVLQL